MRNAREYTCKILGLVDDGVLSSDFVLQEVLANYLSEAEVANFYTDHLSEIVDPFEGE